MEEDEEKWKEETDRGEADSHLIIPPMFWVDLVYTVRSTVMFFAASPATYPDAYHGKLVTS